MIKDRKHTCAVLRHCHVFGKKNFSVDFKPEQRHIKKFHTELFPIWLASIYMITICLVSQSELRFTGQRDSVLINNKHPFCYANVSVKNNNFSLNSWAGVLTYRHQSQALSWTSPSAQDVLCLKNTLCLRNLLDSFFISLVNKLALPGQVWRQSVPDVNAAVWQWPCCRKWAQLIMHGFLQRRRNVRLAFPRITAQQLN